MSDAEVAKLKVFRTAIGFHDAYVAAPSRAAALRAWGADKDLFARGSAEEVTDPALMTEALERPGEIVRRSRGSVAEHPAASPPMAKHRPASAENPSTPSVPTPAKPDRSELDAAEAALAAAEARQRRILAALAEREAALERERRAAEREGRDLARKLERERDRAAAIYGRAVAAQEGSG